MMTGSYIHNIIYSALMLILISCITTERAVAQQVSSICNVSRGGIGGCTTDKDVDENGRFIFHQTNTANDRVNKLCNVIKHDKDKGIIPICIAEGNCHEDGSYIPELRFGHPSLHNTTNRGWCSDEEKTRSDNPIDADNCCLQFIRNGVVPHMIEGIPKDIDDAMFEKYMLVYLDSYNQSPAAATSDGGFFGNLKEVQEKCGSSKSPHKIRISRSKYAKCDSDDMQVTSARINSYVDPATQEFALANYFEERPDCKELFGFLDMALRVAISLCKGNSSTFCEQVREARWDCLYRDQVRRQKGVANVKSASVRPAPKTENLELEDLRDTLSSGCMICPIAGRFFAAAIGYAEVIYPEVATDIVALMGLILIGWIAWNVIPMFSPFMPTKKVPQLANDLVMRVILTSLVTLMLLSPVPHKIYANYVLKPIISTFLSLAYSLEQATPCANLAEENGYADKVKKYKPIEIKSLNEEDHELKDKLERFLYSIQNVFSEGMAMGIYLMFNGQPLEGLIITVLYVAPIIWFSLVALDTVVVWAVFTAVSPFAWLAFIYPKTREYAMTAVKRMMSSGAKLAMISLLAVLMNCIVIDVVGTVSDLLNEKSEVAIKQADQAIKNAQAYQKVLGVQMTNNDTKPAVNRCIDVNEPTEFHLPFKNYDPQKNKVTSPLGWRTLFGKTSYHSGIDFGCREGEPLVAICSGQLVDPRAFKGFSLESLKNIVSRTLNYLGGYGYSAQLDCGNYGFLYAHMPKPPKLVDMGGKNNTDRTASPFDIPCQRENDALKQQNGELLCCVTAGQIIGKCGNTGRSTAPHLHLEYYGVKGAPELPVALGGIGLPKSDGCPEGKRRIPGSSGCMGIGGDDNKEKPSDGNNQQKNTPKNEKPKPQENPPKINPGGIVQPNKEIPEISSIKILDSGIKYVASKVNINQQESITLLQAVGQPTQDVLMAPGPTMLLNFQNILDKLVAQSPTQTTGENNPNNFTTETYGPDPAYPNHGKKHLHLGKTGFIEVVAMGILVLAAFGSGNKLVPESKGGFNLLTQFARITNFIGSLGDEKGKKEVVEGMKAAEQAKQEQEEQKEAEEERKQQEREQAEQQKATTEQQASTTLRKEGEEATSANTNNANNNNDNSPALRNEEYGGNNATENPQGRVATHSSTTNNQDTPQTGNKVNNIGVAAMVAAQGLGKGVLNATIINPVTKIKEDIGNEINKTKENIKNTARTITELPGNIVTSGKELGKTAWEMPGNIVESGKENLENLGKAAVEEWREIKQGASNIIQGTVTTITSIPDTIVRVSEEVAMGIINAPARAGNAIKENFETLRNIAVEELQKIKQDTVDKAVDTLINDWERTVNHVKLAWEMPGNTWENAKYNFDKTIHNIEQNIKNTTDIIVEVGKATWEMPGNIVEVGKEVGKAAWEMPGNIGNKLQEIKQTIISTPDNIVKKWNIAVTAVVATHTSITNKSVQEIREGVAKHTEQAIANAGKAAFGKEQDSDKNAGKNATPKEKTEEKEEKERKANIDNTIAELNRKVVKEHEAGKREGFVGVALDVGANVIGVKLVRKALAKGTKEAREELGLDLTKEEKLKIAGASCMRELSKYEKLRAEEEMRVIVANNEALRPHIEKLNKQNNTNVDDYVSGLRKEQLEVSNEVTRLEEKTNRTQFEERELSKLKIKEQDLNKANAYLSDPNAREQFENYCKRKKEAGELAGKIEEYNKTLEQYTKKIKYTEPKEEQNASPNNNNDEGQNPSKPTPSNLNNLQGSEGGNTQPHSLIPEETPEKKKEERKITIVKKKKGKEKVDKNDKEKNNISPFARQSIEIIKKQ